MATKAPRKSDATPPAEGGQNVTLHLPKELIRRAKAVAAARGLSLSKYFAQGMDRLLRNGHEYEKAYRRFEGYMNDLQDRGGSTIKSRDELYDR